MTEVQLGGRIRPSAPMRLLYNDVSPFARKTRVVAIERGLTEILFEHVDPLGADVAMLHSLNPIGKIPVLVTERGEVIVDSPIICEYLDGLGPRSSLLGAPGAERRDALVRQAVADGVSGLAVSLRMEQRRPEAERSAAWIERWLAAAARTIRSMRVSGHPHDLDIGDIATAVSLLFIQHRIPELEWRIERPELARWLDEVAVRPSFVRTDFFAGEAVEAK